eukprot:8175550-Prorocentrum_lima.AAC.1
MSGASSDALPPARRARTDDLMQVEEIPAAMDAVVKQMQLLESTMTGLSTMIHALQQVSKDSSRATEALHETIENK